MYVVGVSFARQASGKGQGTVTTYSFTTEPRETRANRVEVSQLPPEWVAALEAEWAKHETTPDINHVVDLGDPKEVTKHANYARAWGMSRTGQKVNVRKLPLRTGDKESVLRLSMDKHDPNAPKLGRKTNAEKAASAEKPANTEHKADAK